MNSSTIRIELPTADLGTVSREITWEDDYRDRMNPELLTTLLREAIPVLEYVGWRVVEVGEGYARTVLPSNLESTNQHGTHQAALMVLAADYTGGIALASLLRGVPIVGVHSRVSDGDAALWLANVKIDYLGPSCDHLTLTCSVPSDGFERIRHRFVTGRHVIESLEVDFEAGGRPVATATLGYYARRMKFLRPQSPTDRPSALFDHGLKASARLIAGIRATGDGRIGSPDHDPYSAAAAGAHGALLARRFIRAAPRVRDMVLGRTRDIDERIREALAQGVKQLVFVGVGLDLGAYRLVGPRPGVRIIELDLPAMLAEREQVLRSIPGLPTLSRTPLGVNLDFDDVAEAVLASGDFDPSEPSLIVYEGMSMYFDGTTNARTLGSLARLMTHPDSRLWVDFVSDGLANGQSGLPEAEAFIRGMRRIGEPFVFGLDDPESYFGPLGLAVSAATPSRPLDGDAVDPIFDHYTFYLLEARHPRPRG